MNNDMGQTVVTSFSPSSPPGIFYLFVCLCCLFICIVCLFVSFYVFCEQIKYLNLLNNVVLEVRVKVS